MSEREKLERELRARLERKRRRASRVSHDGVATRSMRNAEQAHLEQPHYQEDTARLPNSRSNLPDTFRVGPHMPSAQEPLHPMGSTASLANSWARQGASSPPPTRRSSDGELRDAQRHLERSPHREALCREETGAPPRRHSAPDSTLRSPDRGGIHISCPLPRQTPLSESSKNRNALTIVPRGEEICGNSPASPTVQEAMFDRERFSTHKSNLNSGTKKFALRSKPDPKASADSASPRTRTVNAAMVSPRAANFEEEVIEEGGGEATDGDADAPKEIGWRSDGRERSALRRQQDEEEVVDEGAQANQAQGAAEGDDDDDDEAVKIVKTSGSENVVRGKNLRSRVVPPRERAEREQRTPPPAPPPKRRKRSPRKVVPEVEANHTHIFKTFDEVLAKEMGVVQLSNNGITTTTLEDVVVIKCNGMKFIQTFILSDNCIQHLPIMFEDVCGRIKVLNLAKNCLAKLDDWVFRACAKNLRQLNLSANELTELPYNVKELVHLELLDVSMNRLTHLPSGLGDLEQLRYLNLADNNLTVLPEDLGFRNLRLTLFNISRNYDFESPFPEAMATHAYHMEDVFFDDTKLKDSLPRRVADKPAPELVLHLTQLSLEEIRENWDRLEKGRAERLEKAQSRRR